MTFEEYLKSEMGNGDTNFKIRATEIIQGRINFKIQPSDKEGKVRDFVVEGNELREQVMVTSG